MVPIPFSGHRLVQHRQIFANPSVNSDGFLLLLHKKLSCRCKRQTGIEKELACGELQDIVRDAFNRVDRFLKLLEAVSSSCFTRRLILSTAIAIQPTACKDVAASELELRELSPEEPEPEPDDTDRLLTEIVAADVQLPLA